MSLCVDKRIATNYNTNMRERKYIPKPQNRTPCYYCGERFATGFDHIIPLHYGGAETNPDNLMPCCIRCNRLLGTKVFNNAAEKREYVLCRLRKKKYAPNVVSSSSRKETGKSSVPLDADGNTGIDTIQESGLRLQLFEFLKQFGRPVSHDLTLRELKFRCRIEIALLK